MLKSLILCYLIGSSLAIATTEDAIVTEAASFGYLVERDGLVLTVDRPKCAIALFGFDNWLNSLVFPNEAKRIVEGSIISNWNALIIINETTHDYVEAIRNRWSKLTSHMTEWKHKKHLKFNVSKPLVHVASKIVDPSLTQEMAIIAKTFQYRADLQTIARSWISQLEDVVFALMRKNLDSAAMKYLGGDDFYRTIAQEILGVDFEGGLAKELGSRLADMTRIDLLGKANELELAVEVCIPNLHRRHGVPFYRIRPWGKLEGTMYSHPNLPTSFSLNHGHNGIDELSVADQILLSHKGITVVTKFEEQSLGCRLTTPSKCSILYTNIDDFNGTAVFPLNENSLVVTREKSGFCAPEIGSRVRVNFDASIFVRYPTNCILEIGGVTIGKRVFSLDLSPEKSLKFHDGNDRIAEMENNRTRWSFCWGLILPIFQVITVLVVAGLVYTSCKYFGKYKRDALIALDNISP